MQRLLLSLTAAIAFAPELPAQDAHRFTHPDFQLSIEIPAGMRELAFDGRVDVLGAHDRPEAMRNVPLAEAGEDGWMNNHIWVDTQPTARLIHMTLVDDIPFESPQAFITMLSNARPVLANGVIAPEAGGPAIWVDQRIETNPPKRVRSYYFVDPGNRRSMQLKFMSREDAWDAWTTQYLDTLLSLEWERKQAVVPNAPAMSSAASSAPNAGGTPNADSAGDEDAEHYADWGNREVMGSLILAGLLLMGLLFGGRGS